MCSKNLLAININLLVNEKATIGPKYVDHKSIKVQIINPLKLCAVGCDCNSISQSVCKIQERFCDINWNSCQNLNYLPHSIFYTLQPDTVPRRYFYWISYTVFTPTGLTYIGVTSTDNTSTGDTPFYLAGVLPFITN